MFTKVYTTIVMRSGSWFKNVKELNFFFFLLEWQPLDIRHKQGLLLVELDENEVVLGDQDLIQDNKACNAEITLYALVGNLSSNTTRVKSRIKNQEIVSLINLGSTHNFLDAAMLLNLNLQIDTSLILEMKVANGSVIIIK